MVQVRRDADVDAATLWSTVTDWAQHGANVPFTEVSARGTEGVGQQVVAMTVLGPLRLSDEMVVTRWEPPADPQAAGVVGLRKQGRVLQGDILIEVHARSANASTLVWNERIRLRPNSIGRLTAPIADLGTRVLFGHLATALVRRAEDA